MIDWTDVAKTLGSTAIACAAIIFIIRTFWSQLLSRDLDGFKAKLENRSTVEIERLRNDLKRVAFEHETRYAKLHEKRAAGRPWSSVLPSLLGGTRRVGQPSTQPKRTPLNFRVPDPAVFAGSGFRRRTFDHHSKAHAPNHFGQ